MNDQDQSEWPTELPERGVAKTAELPRLPISAKAHDDFRVGQSRILELIAADAPLSDILERLMLLIEAQSPDMICSVLLLSEDGNHIRHGAAPSLPDDYVKAIDGAPIGPKNGSCGTAMHRGSPVYVTDIMTDPLWEDYRGLAAAAGLRACWSTPILSPRGKVLGSFAMYYRQPQIPSGAEAELTEVATRIAALAIEHQAARETLDRTRAQLALATSAASKGEAVASSAQEITNQLEAIVNNTAKCLEVLNEDQPDTSVLRRPLLSILADARHALEIMGKIRK